MSLPWHIAPTPQIRKRYLCCRASGRPTIDGRLDKAFWELAPWSEEFVDIEGDARPLPRFRTRFKMVWDDECLYVGAEMEEPHVWGTLTERDSIVYHDNDFEVFLSPTGDNHNYYEIEVNALNTIFDLFLAKPYRDGGPADHGWDAKGLRTAVSVRGTLNDPSDVDEGWSVEMAIPWKAFDRHGVEAERCPSAGDQWRFNFSRVQWEHEIVDGNYRKVPGRPEQNWVWSPQGIIDMHRPEQWGYVQFAATTTPSESVREDPCLPYFDALMAVYYAQRKFMRVRGKFAAHLGELAEFGLAERERLPKIELESLGERWKATMAAATCTGARAIAIVDDSRMTVVR